MPSLVTDWHAKEQRILAALTKVRVKQDKLREEHDRLTLELAHARAGLRRGAARRETRFKVRFWEGRDGENVEASEVFDSEAEAESFLGRIPPHNLVTGAVEVVR